MNLCTVLLCPMVTAQVGNHDNVRFIFHCNGLLLLNLRINAIMANILHIKSQKSVLTFSINKYFGGFI